MLRVAGRRSIGTLSWRVAELALAAIAAVSCRVVDFNATSASFSQAFANAELPHAQRVSTRFVFPDRRIAVFDVLYGEPSNCFDGCIYPRASGLQLGDRIGWLIVYDSTPAPGSLTAFALSPGDTPLFDEWKAHNARADRSFADKLMPFLARHPNTPESVLLPIAQRLELNVSTYIASLLLSNPSVRGYPSVLWVIACLPDRSVNAYAWARGQARAQLGDVFTKCPGDL